MRKLLVFQHSAREPLGLLDPLLRRHGFRIRYLNFSRQPELTPDVSRYNGLIVLGGPKYFGGPYTYDQCEEERIKLPEETRSSFMCIRENRRPERYGSY